MLLQRTSAIWIGLAVVLVCCSVGEAVDYYVTQLTDNDYNDVNPQINTNGYVVWEGDSGTYPQIYLYDGTSTSQLSDHLYGGYDPQINDSQQVVWLGYEDTNDGEIFLFEGTSTTQLTDNAYADGYAQLANNGYVVWQGCVGGAGLSCNSPSDFEILLYDGTSTTQLTDNDYNDEYPKVNDSGQVAWEKGSSSAAKVFLYDGTSTIELTGGNNHDMSPEINDNGWVAWRGCEGFDCPGGPDVLDVFLYDGTSTSSIPDPVEVDSILPQLNNSGYVVWQSDNEIFLYDGSSTTQLTNNAYYDQTPQINDDGHVVWEGDGEIYLYDGTSTTRFTDNDYQDRLPQIGDDGSVVWAGCEGDDTPGGGCDTDFEIFLKTPCTDNDGDGYNLEVGCPEPLDCNDTNDNINPATTNSYCDCGQPYPQGTTEACTGGFDEDCDGLIDDADPDCGSSCAGTARASTLGASPVHGASDLAQHLGYFMFPMAAVIGLMIWRRKR